MNSVRGSCKDGRDGAGDLPSSHRLAVISGSAMSAALCPYCSDSIAAPRPARRRSPIRRHRNETFAVRLGTRVPRSGVGPGFVIYTLQYTHIISMLVYLLHRGTSEGCEARKKEIMLGTAAFPRLAGSLWRVACGDARIIIPGSKAIL